MTEKVAVAFLITLVTLFLAVFAVPLTYNTLDVKHAKYVTHSMDFPCRIPCHSCHDDPICATDGQTYGCPNALWCYKACGQQIDVAYHGPCQEKGSATPPKENQECKEKDPLAPPRESQKY